MAVESKFPFFLEHVAPFVRSPDLAAMVLVNKEWLRVLTSSSYHLTFDGRSRESNEALTSFLRSFPRLSSLSIENFLGTIQETPREFSSVRILQVSNCDSAESILSYFTFPALRAVVFRNGRANHSHIARHLEHCSNLSAITLTGQFNLSDDAVVRIVNNCQSLRHLEISRAGFLQLGRIWLEPVRIQNHDSCLESIVLCHISGNVISAPLDERAKPKFPQLQSLEFRCVGVADETIPTILHHSPALRRLSIEVNQHLKAASISSQFNLNHLSFRSNIALQRLTVEACWSLATIDLTMCFALRELCVRQLHCLTALDLNMLSSLETLRVDSCNELRSLLLNGCAELCKGTQTSGTVLRSIAASRAGEDSADVEMSPAVQAFVIMIAQNAPKVDLAELVLNQASGTILQDESSAIITLLKALP